MGLQAPVYGDGMIGVPSKLPKGIMRLLARLARDNRGNVLLIFAASLFPLLALIGSGIDMGRGYLAETRLQQACDAGVLAARKRLGTEVAVGGEIPGAVADTGQRFFNINFRDGAYGAEGRDFQMILEDDLAISGTASADVPTTLMSLFGHRFLEVSVACQAQVNMSNTDIMMVLDTTGSMLFTNDGDDVDRITALRNTVKSFHAQMEANKSTGTRIRYGFVPYSTNVNVGHLMQDGWLVDDEWEYNFREAKGGGKLEERPVYETNYELMSGGVENGTSYYESACPASDKTWTLLEEWTDADGWKHQRALETGTQYNCTQVDTSTWEVTPRTYNDHTYIWSTRQTGTETFDAGTWRYATMKFDLGFLNNSTSTTVPMGGTPSNPVDVSVSYRGCIEERATYDILDYDNVDLSKALDLDLDTPPDPDDEDTQWKPMIGELSYAREQKINGKGKFTPGAVNSDENFVNSYWWGFAACPSPALGLAEMTASEVATYVDNLDVQGSTYHDIGMIWGGRLISPTGMFAPEDDDAESQTSRHMIFLTDGETAPYDISYTSYGIEPIDRRRWSQNSKLTLTETVEARFSFACEEVKRRNVTVWVISFGTDANPVMQSCAGDGRYFVAADAEQLQDAFSDIAARMGELRITN